MAPNYHREYQKNEVSTSNQGKLVLMMYDGALKFTRMALQCMDTQDIPGKCTYIRKTQDIVNELSLSLNMEKGGEISNKLESLYRFILNQLTLANIKDDRKALETVLKIMTPLREAWDQIFHPPTLDEAGSVEPPSPPPAGKKPSFKVSC